MGSKILALALGFVLHLPPVDIGVDLGLGPVSILVYASVKNAILD